jgi:hypothetical protein
MLDGSGPRGTFYDVRTVQIELPRLTPDSAASCPVPFEQVLEHAATEFDDGTDKPQMHLTFLRTARIAETSYWIWTFSDPEDGESYVLVSLWPPNIACIECDDTFEMTPEQFIVATHFKLEP